MGKKKTCCNRCKRPNMPKDSNFLTHSLTSSKSYIHWIVVFIVFVLLGTYLLPEIQKEEEDHLSYYAAKIDLLKMKLPAIQISGIDFVSSAVRERLVEMAYQMEFVCGERSDDVIYAFQFGTEKHTRFREDHIFALCGEKTKVYGNAEVVSYSDDKVLCAEEYDGLLKQVKRPASIYIKVLDIWDWEIREIYVDDSKEACVIQHAIDVLESKWI